MSACLSGCGRAVHWIDGGTTGQDNGVLLLRGYHHRLIHHSDWQVAVVDHVLGLRHPNSSTPNANPSGAADDTAYDDIAEGERWPATGHPACVRLRS